MEKNGVTRFPRPVEGRIPNFKGAKTAAEKLSNLPVFQKADIIKVNPDSPQHPVRAAVIREDKILYMPTPRLRNGFLRINSENVPPAEINKATTIRHSKKYGKEVEPEEMEEVDLIVAGSVAVTEDGKRVGKGGGYSDLEYAIVRELDLGKPPVATTVHPLQAVEDLPFQSHDVSVDWIVTSENVIHTLTPFEKPQGINWSQLEEEYLQKIPVLQKLR